MLQETQRAVQVGDGVALHGFEARQAPARAGRAAAGPGRGAGDGGPRHRRVAAGADAPWWSTSIERSGALTLQIKQAEALVEMMRRERTLACDVSAAVAPLREEDEEPAPKA